MMAQDSAIRPVVLLRVLVADSGASVNESLVALLSDFEGLSVFGCAQDPGRVLTLVRRLNPDVVLLDLHMEERAGLRILKQIKSLPQPPLVVVLSHCDLPPIREAALAAGADYFFLKATECGRLQEVFGNLLRQRETRIRESTV